ncbi:uncharacterized protein LOC114517938 [Dendronephthya gigantea]|uniref:uncharacterized protein LOC114517938 n=1 Tax=Dendronephthya gigantea TaxID=151771 RepID=UPI00106D6372|nr:uncharacterized protein LOC114517938 [Dendronephthya gigantea]
MAAVCEEFPSESLLHELISSFPRAWQGLFASLNVRESLAVHSGTKWLRDNSQSIVKSKTDFISPHWPDLIRSLCLSFPVALGEHVIFQSKFSCFTLILQRNVLGFIVYYSEKIPVDDIKIFVAMLEALPQMKKYWFAALVSILQIQVKSREENPKSIKVSACNFISERNQIRLGNLCSKLKHSSAASSSLLTAKLELLPAFSSNSQRNVAMENKELISDQDGCNPVTSMEIDNVSQSEVIEISDDSPEMSPLESTEIPNPPEMKVEISVEPEQSEEDAFLEKYIPFKDHLRSLEDLDAVIFQAFLNVFLENTSNDLVKICTFLDVSTIPETSLVMLIKQFLLLEKESSFQATIVFAEYCIGSWLSTLQQAGSRNLLAAVASFAQKHPKSFVDGVMVTLFNTTSFLWPQCDLTVKVIKNLKNDTLLYFMEKLLQSDRKEVWNEHMIHFLVTVLDRRLDLDISHFEKFVNWLQFQSLSHAKSLKFAKFICTIINKYAEFVKIWLSTFKQILEENKTFLKKSGLTALKKLED